MRILLTCEDFRIGGAQVFVLRLANALSKQHQVTLFGMYTDLIDHALVEKYAPLVQMVTPSLWMDPIIRKIDRLLYLLKVDFIIRDCLVSYVLRRVIRKKGIDIVHSNMFKCDYVLAMALQSMPEIPLIVTTHGNYEGFMDTYTGRKDGEIILNYPSKLKFTLQRMNALVYLTQKNLRPLDEGFIQNSDIEPILLRKVYNGFAGKVTHKVSRQTLKIESAKLVYGFVARGIPEKGWKTVLEAFTQLQYDHLHIIMVGWSAYVEELSKEYAHQSHVHFVGYSDNPLDWIELIDVGLLPSVYGESLPNVIAEYLYLKKPVICTDIGDSKNMINYEKESAGFVLSSDSKDLSGELSKCMEEYLLRSDLLEKHRHLAGQAFNKFRMENCVVAYEALYNTCLK